MAAALLDLGYTCRTIAYTVWPDQNLAAFCIPWLCNMTATKIPYYTSTTWIPLSPMDFIWLVPAQEVFLGLIHMGVCGFGP
ncbi:hypothetical protein GDO78_008738 [Eleutherodactylus coqui]|uniref:Uncharacterized protein n=1 Tax=Eleutherodactylus coqui TaxID=57060 RepID=A0A8J6FDV4_ELECQ|nr:hypothetical protein GDO78_008738 [Eleutherodactylus coqui]